MSTELGNDFAAAEAVIDPLKPGATWIDPARDLVVACCTSRVYYGRNCAGILDSQVALHRAIVEAVDA